MSNRLLLNTSGFKISQPGVNVLTAGYSGLQFSSDWSTAPVTQSGNFNIFSNREQEIEFGRTYTGVPLVLFKITGEAQDFVSGNDYYVTRIGECEINMYSQTAVLISAYYIGVENHRFLIHSSGYNLHVSYYLWDIDLF